jgi:hypothetical protein
MNPHSGGSNVHAWWLAEIIDYCPRASFADRSRMSILNSVALDKLQGAGTTALKIIASHARSHDGAAQEGYFPLRHVCDERRKTSF